MTKAEELRRILFLLESFFKSKRKANLWIEIPNHLLGDIAPRQMIEAGRGKKVLKFIETSLGETHKPDCVSMVPTLNRFKCNCDHEKILKK